MKIVPRYVTSFGAAWAVSWGLLSGSTPIWADPATDANAPAEVRAQAVDQDAAAADESWTELFDGKTLEGWEQRNGTAKYTVEDGAIVGRTAEGSPNSFLATVKDYGDFELTFDVKCDERLNSGVQIRSNTGETRTGRVNGPQVEIEGSPGESGYVYGEATGRGWLTPPERLKTHEHFQNGKWNSYRVKAVGPRIQTWINGTMIEELTDEPIFKSHPTGFLALQVHSIPKGQGPYEVRWKNIKIRPLDRDAK